MKSLKCVFINEIKTPEAISKWSTKALVNKGWYRCENRILCIEYIIYIKCKRPRKLGSASYEYFCLPDEGIRKLMRIFI